MKVMEWSYGWLDDKHIMNDCMKKLCQAFWLSTNNVPFDSKNAPWDHFFSKLKWHYLYVTSTQNKCWPKMPHGTTTFHEYTKLNMTIVSGMSKNDWQPIDALSNSVYMLRIHKTSVDLCLQNCPMGPLLF